MSGEGIAKMKRDEMSVNIILVSDIQMMLMRLMKSITIAKAREK